MTKKLIAEQTSVAELAHELGVSSKTIAHGLTNILNQMSNGKRTTVCMYFGIDWEEVGEVGKKYTIDEISYKIHLPRESVLDIIQDVLENPELTNPSSSVYRENYYNGDGE